MATKPLLPPKAPALPFAPVQYAQKYQDDFANVLRLYFNTLDSCVAQLTQATGGSGAGVYLPYGAFSCFAQTTLTANINNAVITIPVVSTASFPIASVSAPKAFYIGTEIVIYTGQTPTSFTGCTRGALSTTPASHLANAPIEGVQIAYAANTGYALFFNTTDFASGTSLTDTTKMTVANAGIYNMQFSVQIENRNTAPQDVYIWLKQNGTDITGSTGKVGMPARKTPTDPSHDIKGWNYFLSMNVGDYVEIWWSTTALDVIIPNYIATPLPDKPSTASVVATMTFVSAI